MLSLVASSSLLTAVLAGVMLAIMPAVVGLLRLNRRNFAGKTVSTGYGVVVWLPATVALAWYATHRLTGAAPAATALLLFGMVGLADDLWGDRSVGGFRGHLRQLVERGRVTTGIIKLAIGGGASLVLGLWVTGDAAPPMLRVLLEPAAPSTASLPPLPDLAAASPPGWLGILEVLTAAAVIAFSANTLNLLDLRPLRALKVAALALLLIIVGAVGAASIDAWLPTSSFGWPYWLRTSAGSPALAVELLTPALIAAAIYAPWEARQRAMLGDTGANALGALLGVVACVALPLLGQTLLAVALAGINLYAERHSLSAFIRAHPTLDWLDRWGWSTVEEVTPTRGAK
jgi:UDP-GlcNAc:undecaprenyl-phosphate GlcNAc-1-phosphate transferase